VKAYGLALQSMLNKEVDFDSDTVKAMLVTSTYTPNQDTHRYKSSVTGESSGSGYTAGGVALTGRTVTYDTATNTLVLDCDDPTWAAVSVTARYIVFYVSTGVDTTSPLLCYEDFGSNKTSAGGAFIFQVPATGLLRLTAA
jgi:hypothetical protein